MTIKAELLLASRDAGTGEFPIATFVLHYPRFIHSQLMTHRVFSRNVSSSRAVPVLKMIERVENDPVRPLFWGKNQKGMEAEVELDEESKILANVFWDSAMADAIRTAKQLNSIGAHKQIVNRVLEPFMHVDTILTGTEFVNFFKLRRNHAAQPEIQELANQMYELLGECGSSIQNLEPGQWHLPFGEDLDNLVLDGFDVAYPHQMVSAARCARVSYTAPDALERNIEKDLELAVRLQKEKHMSPFEHQAMCAGSCMQSGNFTGWIQFRGILEEYYVN